METEFHYTWVKRNLSVITNEQLFDYIEQFRSKLDKDLWFTLFQECKYINNKLYVPMFIILHYYYPAEAINQLKHSTTWIHYIDMLNKLLIDDSHELLSKKIIQIIIEQLYNERYNDKPVTSLSIHLPREGKHLDKQTNITYILAKNYYNLYIERNQENEWDDILCHTTYKKGIPLKLYRHDCTFLHKKYNNKNKYEKLRISTF